jgi:hypothetical protein
MSFANDRRSKAMDNDPVNVSSAPQAGSVAIKLRLQQQVAATALTREAVHAPEDVKSVGRSSYDRVLDLSA